MAKTVKEIANKVLNMSNLLTYSPEDLKEFTKDILQAHENEIATKDKEHIEQLKRMYEQFKYDKELKIGQYKFKTEQQILFKEDFDLTCYAECNCDGEGCGYGLIDNSKYDKLPSKDVK